MKHPPIPPNSPYFQRDDVGDWFKYPVIGGLNGLNHAWLGIDSGNGETSMIWRPIIAAVAAEAWNDELIRRDNAKPWSEKAWLEVFNNIEAWRAWGKVVV